MFFEIHEILHLASMLKICVELEADLNMRELKFKFLNTSATVCSVHKEMIKPKERKF